MIAKIEKRIFNKNNCIFLRKIEITKKYFPIPIFDGKINQPELAICKI